MSDEHGWPDFDHEHHEHAVVPEPADHDDSVFPAPEEPDFDDDGYDDDLAGHEDAAGHEVAHDDATPDIPEPGPDEPVIVHAASTLGPIGADPDASVDDGIPVDVFPPVVDVGPLPEPIDGFPWSDTGSLGLAALTPSTAAVAPVSPQDLAEYAAEDLPPAVDPWAALAGSDDPATAALARWWSTEN